jgi:uncharacterized membrane protein YbhN (UPF0104 family)
LEAVGNVLSTPEWREYFQADQSELGDRLLPVLLTVGAVLSLAGLALITWIAGWPNVWKTLLHADWVFALVAPVAVAVSHLGYTVAYREVARVEGGPQLSVREVVAIVTTGFGPVSPRGGFTLDAQELCKRGLSEEEASLSVRVLGLLEYAVLAPGTFLAALYMIVRGMKAQAGLVPSWVIGVPVGAVLALTVLARYRRAGRPGGWWKPLRHGLEAVEALFELFGSWSEGAVASLGMAIYWAGDIAALGACLDVFAHRRGAVAVLIVGYATGYALTRRSLPLGGAGVVEVLMPLALNWVGFTLASAVLAVVAYRIFNLWLAMIPAVIGLRRLRHHSDAGRSHAPAEPDS